MTLAPVRPLFQNGQRLTAERLTQALEFLRTMLRRVLLAPLSAGVAEGFGFTPIFGENLDTLTIEPGLAIDGQGRLLLVPLQQRFTIDQLVALAGANIAQASATTPIAIRVCLALDDQSAANDPCDPYRPSAVEETARFIFDAEDAATVLTQIVNQFQHPNCVPAYANLDNPPTGDTCCVTLGHVLIYSATELTATTFFRQGVSPRFNAIRNTDGTPSIFLNQLKFDGSALGLPIVDEPGVGVPVMTLIGPKPFAVTGSAGFYGNTAFVHAGGLFNQATHVGPFNAPYQAGTFAAGPPGNSRIFLFGGGAGDFNATTQTSELPNGFGGVCAVPCELKPGTPDVNLSGVPLAIADAASSDVLVEVATTQDLTLLGVSAGPHVVVNGKRIVPVAVAGVVKATVEHGTTVGSGAELTASSTSGNLREVSGPSERVVARLAKGYFGSSGSDRLFVWVTQPSVGQT